MNSNAKILIVVIVVVILFLLILCSHCVKGKQISGFEQINHTNKIDGYSDIKHPYDKPFILKNFITLDHCNKIISYANGKLFDSEVVGGKHTNVRNSQQCWIPKNDPLAKPMFEKVSKMFNIPFENAEDLQVVRYLPNQYYNEHHDSCCDDNDKCIDFAKKGGQRKITVLVYLNNEFDGGNTHFKNLNLKVKPLTGDSVVFFPLAKGTSKCHPLALHAGMPVTSGEKWVANLWFREGKFQ